jgi:hypothetical protein
MTIRVRLEGTPREWEQENPVLLALRAVAEALVND